MYVGFTNYEFCYKMVFYFVNYCIGAWGYQESQFMFHFLVISLNILHWPAHKNTWYNDPLINKFCLIGQSSPQLSHFTIYYTINTIVQLYLGISLKGMFMLIWYFKIWCNPKTIYISPIEKRNLIKIFTVLENPQVLVWYLIYEK